MSPWRNGSTREDSTYLAGGLDAVLAGLGRGQESIILRAGELFEAGRVVWKTEGIRHLRQEVLFGEPKEGQGHCILNLDCPSSCYLRIHLRNLELATCTDRNVIEVLHTPLYGH